MEFNIKNTPIYAAEKRSRIFLFKYADFLNKLFLSVFMLSCFFVFTLYLSGADKTLAIKTAVAFFLLGIIFWDIKLFAELKIKSSKIRSSLSEAVLGTDNYNLAEFLSLNSVSIVRNMIKFCKNKKNIPDSSVLLYSLLEKGTEAPYVFLKLGIDIKKAKEDLRNYLEKMPKHPGLLSLSEDLKKIFLEAANISVNRNHGAIGENELLVAVSKNDIFFKKLMIDYDLKLEDIENITLWSDSAKESFEKRKQFWSQENLLRLGSLGKDWAAGYTLTLNQYSTDLRDIVSKWTFREVIGHKKEIEATEMILAKSGLSNVLIIGNSGVGRKSIVEALAQKCYLGKSLPELNNKRVVELDMVKLSAKIQDFEKMESELNQIFSEALQAGNVILVIENLENFIYQSEKRAGSVDITGILSKYLSIPNFQFIGITTYDGLHKNIEQNQGFSEMFKKVEVSEITESETIRILQAVALELEYKHKILILYPAIREIVNLTARYMPSLPFPKKALDVLDEVVIYAQSHKDGFSDRLGAVVMPHHVAEVISYKTEIPVGKMEVKEKETLLNLESLIHKTLINQNEAVKEISTAMRRARSGISSKKRPMGTFLFLGPTGVGKTQTAKALSQIYFKSKSSDQNQDKMIRIDMSEFQSVADIPRLIGSVSPVEMQGLLTTPVRETPFSLVLLDEIEKAHPNILNLFLQILDEGHVTDGQGRKVVFTNTIMIFTSNAGADVIFKAAEKGLNVKKDKLLDNLFEKGIFRPEFINRFDSVVIFHPLTKENLLDIAGLMLNEIRKNLKEKEIDFEITEILKSKIVELSYKPAYGAREMRRIIQDKIENSISEALIAEEIKKGDNIKIDPESFEIIKSQQY
jgi:ATP-dependent Clp protease ATP-binding subunit ClpC